MEVFSDKDRLVINTGGVGDEMSIARWGDEFFIEIDEPWQGDTVTGFGAKCSVVIPRNVAEELRDWLSAALKQKSRPPSKTI